MTLEGTLLLFLRKNKKWNTSYGPGLEGSSGGGGGGSAVQQHFYSQVLALVGSPLVVAAGQVVVAAVQLVGVAAGLACQLEKLASPMFYSDKQFFPISCIS